MDVSKMLADVRAERGQLCKAILVLERLRYRLRLVYTRHLATPRPANGEDSARFAETEIARLHE
jgi:hypothetical protein